MASERFEVDNPAIKPIMQDIARTIEGALPPDKSWGFALFLFEYGPDGACFYASSAEREGVLGAVQEWLERQDDVPNWKAVAIALMAKFAGLQTEVVITDADLGAVIGDRRDTDVTVTVRQREDAMHVLLSMESPTERSSQ